MNIIKSFYPVILVEIYAMLHIPMKEFLYFYRAKTYQPYPYLLYSRISYLIFGILLGIFILWLKKYESRKIYIALLFINLIYLGIMLCISLSYELQFVLILMGISIIGIYATSKNRNR